MKKLILSLFLLSSVFAIASEQVSNFKANALKVIELKSGASDVEVKAVDSKDVKVSLSKGNIDNCDVKMITENKRLKIHIESVSMKKECDIDVKVEAPSRLALKVKSGSGDLLISKMQAPIKYNLGSGDVDLQGSLSKVSGKTGSGDVQLVGEAQKVNLATGSGDMSFRFLKVSKGASVEVKSGSGDAQISIPTTTTIKTDFKSGSGSLKTQLAQTKDADLSIRFRSGSGNLSIEATQSITR